MANIFRFLIFICLLSPAFVIAQSVPAGVVDLAGWINGTDGIYSRAFTDGNGTRATPTNNTVSGTSTALVNTSKGQTLIEITKTATVDIPRVGSAVAGLMKKAGPVGMSVAAVSLVCELTTICDQAGQWMMNADPSIAGYPSTLDSVGFYYVAGITSYQYPTPSIGCSSAASVAKFWGDGKTGSGSGTGATSCTVTTTSNGSSFVTSITFAPGSCPTSYSVSGSTCVLSGNPVSTAPTAADWDLKAPLLNDERLVSELQDKQQDIPTGIPTLTPGQKKELGLDSTPTKDSQGNITGREDTLTELEPIDAGTGDNPGRVIVKETITKIQYDNSNTQISTTTSTSYSSSPPPEKPPVQYEIKFDVVEPAELLTYNVPNTYASTSWGNGSCPPDIDLTLGMGHFVIPTTPICDTAENINPFVLALSALFSIYIVAGVRASNS